MNVQLFIPFVVITAYRKVGKKGCFVRDDNLIVRASAVVVVIHQLIIKFLLFCI